MPQVFLHTGPNVLKNDDDLAAFIEQLKAVTAGVLSVDAHEVDVLSNRRNPADFTKWGVLVLVDAMWSVERDEQREELAAAFQERLQEICPPGLNIASKIDFTDGLWRTGTSPI